MAGLRRAGGGGIQLNRWGNAQKNSATYWGKAPEKSQTQAFVTMAAANPFWISPEFMANCRSWGRWPSGPSAPEAAYPPSQAWRMFLGNRGVVHFTVTEQ